MSIGTILLIVLIIILLARIIHGGVGFWEVSGD